MSQRLTYRGSLGAFGCGLTHVLREVQVCHAMALQRASQALAHQQEQQELSAVAALQPVLDISFGQADTALARQQDLSTVSDCITAVAAQYLGSDNAICRRIQNAFVSMFTAASLPRLASLPPMNREAQLRQLADICVGKHCRNS